MTNVKKIHIYKELSQELVRSFNVFCEIVWCIYICYIIYTLW